MEQEQAYTPGAFLAWLDDKINAVNALEAQGREAGAAGQQQTYSDIMRKKAMLLAELEDEAAPYLDALDKPPVVAFAARALASFSFNANRALEIDSVFYMSALLFPDNHKAGEPNNLEIFRGEIKTRLGL